MVPAPGDGDEPIAEQRFGARPRLTRKLLRTFSDATHSWGVTPGHYAVAVGSSSAEQRAAVSFVVDRRWR
jgi:hypothetical protein